RLESVSATQARARLTDWLGQQMRRQQFETETEFGPPTLPAAFLEAARRHGNKLVLQDASLTQLTYRTPLRAANVLAARWLKRSSAAGARIGVFLPNATAMPVTLLSLWAAGKVPAILNYTTGPAILLACARLAGLKLVITSRLFLERARLDVSPLKN